MHWSEGVNVHLLVFLNTLFAGGKRKPLICRMLKTWFQLILPVPNHNVTKNLTDHRMHVECPQMYQMNRQINSFQNVCDMLYAKIDRVARKIDSLQKKHSCVNRN